MLPKIEECKIAIIGLGYVGFPLAVAFSKLREVVAFDTDEFRIQSLNSGIDYTGEIEPAAFSELKTLLLTSDIRDICPCDVYIVCVPTPIDSSKSPDLNPLIEATRMVVMPSQKIT